MRLQLQVLLQALEDILTYELNLPHAGVSSRKESEKHYWDALEYIAKYPRLMRRLKSRDKRKWLRELQKVREELS